MWSKIKSVLLQNKSARQTVAKNTFWLFVSNFGGRLLKAVAIIYGARVLGTAGWGVFSYAITLAGFFTLFIDPGINSLVLRDAAKSSGEEKGSLIATALFMKIVLVILVSLIVIFIAPFFSTLPGAKILLPIVTLVIVFDTFREFFSSVIRSMEKMEWEAGIFLLTNLGIMTAGLIFLRIRPTPVSLSWAYVVGTGIGAVTATIVIRPYLSRLFSNFSIIVAKKIVFSAWPFAVAGALGILLTNTDVLIISWLRNASDVGIYSAAIRIIQILYIIPSILQYSTLPLLARLANTSSEKFRRGLEQTLSIIFMLSIPIALGGAILSGQIMQFIFGQSYAAGSTAFRILMLTMCVDFPAAIISAALFSYNSQRSLIVASGIGGIVNVVLDLILIPRFGLAGSATATLIAQILLNWYLWHTMKKINYFSVTPLLSRILAAAGVMTIATVLFSSLGVPVLINIAVSGAIYFSALFLLKEPLFWELKSLYQHGSL